MLRTRTLASGAVLWPPALTLEALLEGGGVLRVLVGALGDEAPRVGEAADGSLVHLARAPAPWCTLTARPRPG